MKVQKKLHIQITDRLTDRTVDLVQYDTGIQLVFYFADFRIPNGTTATLYVQKPSGKFVYQETGIAVSENTVTVDLENHAVTEYGTVGAQLQLINGEDTVSTAACTLRVAQSLKDAGAEESKTVIAAFDAETAEQIALIKESAQQQIALIEATSAAGKEAIVGEGLRVLNSIPADYTETAAMAEQAIREKAGVIVCKASGEVIALRDTTDDHIRGLALFGKTTQQSYTGKNLFELTLGAITQKGVSCVKNADGSVTLNGTAESDAFFLLNTCDLGEGEYILSGCPTGGGTRTYRLFDDVAKLTDLGNGVKVNGGYTAKVYIFIGAGYTASNLTFYPMIRDASVSDATYEPYTGGAPSPSPGYPQPLESVGDGGSVAVTVAGKNLLNIPEEVTFTRLHLVDLDVPLQPGTYTVSAEITSNDTDTNCSNIGFMGGESNGGNTYATLYRNTRSSATITIYNPVSQIRLNAADTAANSTGDTATYRKIQIEKGDIATAYQPIQTLIVSTIHEDGSPNGLPGIPVSIGGNYTDKNGQKWICDEIDFERGVYVQRVGTVVYTGTESGWGYDTSGKNPCFYRTLYALKLMPYAFSSHFAFAMAPYAKPNGTTGLFGWESTYSVLYVASELTTLDAWKAYLAEQNANGTPVTVKYLLREPIETPIPEEELAAYRALHTNHPNTTVYNDGGAGMEIRYNADTKTYIDNKFAELAQALVNNL